MSLLLPVMGILLVTSEWSQRTDMTTFALEPHRSRVIMAKLVTGVVLDSSSPRSPSSRAPWPTWRTG